CRLQGEREEVAQAIYEHYLPLGAGKKIPQTIIGVILSIADKIDNIVGYFGIGLTPTGGEDPYALRRHTLGIISILLQREINLNLDDLISKSIDLYQEKLLRQRKDILKEVKEFFAQRLYYYLLSLGYKPDILEGVISEGLHDIKEATERIKVITLLKEDPDFYPFIIAYKRVANILASKAKGGEVNEELLAEEAERKLFQTYLDVSLKSEGYLKKGDYFAYLKEILRLKGTIDNFFDSVLVMTEDRAIRENRLSLLAKIQGLFLKVADFSKIVVEGS
ncbi:MAG: glycine--tRNA ligase subunit beta, partial [bacterium]|nr:glycine--tRNA ligase subunit beta [bacterium]